MLNSIALLCVVTQTAPEMRLMRFPTVYGDTVVFTYAGDLWTASTEGGLARRLTTHPGTEQFARFSPDGKWIAFTGVYDGNPDVYVIPSEGGSPKRLTFDTNPDLVRGWTPDGKVAYISNTNTPGGFTMGLKYVSVDGGLPTETKLMEVADLSFGPNGAIAFNRNNSHNFNWRRYRGGTQGRIAFSDTNATSYKEIPSGKENRWQPMYIGDKVYYIGDKTNGTRNIWSYDTKSGKETQITNFTDSDIKWPSTDGKTIVFERDGRLQRLDVATNKVTDLVYRVAGDMNFARPRMYEYGNSVGNFSLSPSGNRILVEARGELFSVPARTGDTRNIGGTSASREWNPAWSPDGKTIAFISDKSGEDRIYTMPQMGGDWTELKTPAGVYITSLRWAPDSKKLSFTSTNNSLYIFDLDTNSSTLVYTSDYNGAENHDWSPDSNWITYSNMGKNLFAAIWLYDVKAKKNHQVTEGYYNDQTASFDVNGKFLYLVSQRVFNPTPGDFEFDLMMTNSARVYALPLQKDLPNPMARPGDEEPAGEAPTTPQPPAAGPIKIDLDGLAARAIPLPWGPSQYPALVGLNNGVMVFNNGVWKMFDWNSKASSDVLPGATSLDLNPTRTKIAFKIGNQLGIADLRPGIDPNSGRVNLGNAEGILDPKSEWRQIFWQAWRWERDRFYDKDMLGLDWKKIGLQYEKYLPFVSHRADLNYVLGLMLGELGTGHAYVQGGDMGVQVANIPTGMLGADYEKSGNGIRFKKIYRGLNFEEPRRGPLAEQGVDVKEGEFLVAIDGVPVGTKSPSELLINKVGRPVTLTVNSTASLTGARKVVVRPVATEDELRYIEWVEGNRRKVSELSGGKIGYMHVPDTSIEGMTEFAKGYYSQGDKLAMIVDERFNGGGMIPTFFVEKLNRKYLTAFKQRNGADVPFPPNSMDMPQVMLVNEYAGSGGDLFPYFFRQAKLGPLVGMRTWGGLVGITGNSPFVDGGGVTAPEFGLYDINTGEWIAENKGIDPDVAVDARPDLIASGKDPQLEKAVEILLAEIKKGRKPFKEPTFPKVGKPGN